MTAKDRNFLEKLVREGVGYGLTSYFSRSEIEQLNDEDFRKLLELAANVQRGCDQCKYDRNHCEGHDGAVLLSDYLKKWMETDSGTAGAIRLIEFDQAQSLPEFKRSNKGLLKDGYVYLASPYSHLDPEVMARRARDADFMTASLLKAGIPVYGAITTSHELAKRFHLPSTWEFWQQADTAFVRASEAVFVLTLEGWKESVGVQAEIELAHQEQIPVFAIDTVLVVYGRIVKKELNGRKSLTV